MCTATFCWPAMKINFRTPIRPSRWCHYSPCLCVQDQSKVVQPAGVHGTGVPFHGTPEGKKYHFRLGRVQLQAAHAGRTLVLITLSSSSTKWGLPCNTKATLNLSHSWVNIVLESCLKRQVEKFMQSSLCRSPQASPACALLPSQLCHPEVCKSYIIWATDILKNKQRTELAMEMCDHTCRMSTRKGLPKVEKTWMHTR